MYCRNCGAEIDDDSRFCGFCGAKVEAENEAETPGSDRSPFASTPLPDNTPGVDPTAWIVLSVIEIVLCGSVIPGVIGLIFGISAENCRKTGDWEGTRSNLGVARAAVFIGLGLLLVELFLGLVGGFLLGFIV